MVNKRNTKQKEILIEYLTKNSNKHLTIQEIYNNLDKEIGLTTIYRIINCLIKEGNVLKIPLENQQGFCYQYNMKDINCSNHYHLVCEQCGKLLHFETDIINNIFKEAIQKDEFDINKEKIVFYGKCKKCKD